MSTSRSDRSASVDRSLSVVGGSVIGLAAALAAADAGWRVRVFDAGPAGRAGDVAGGMLGCLGEGDPAQPRLLRLTAASSALWPAFLGRLGDPSVRVAADSLLVGASRADLGRLRDEAGYLHEHLDGARERLTTLSAAELRAAERGLSRAVLGGYLAAGEGAVDNRALLAALTRALAAAGVEVVAERVEDLARLPAGQILLAAGMGTPDLWPGGAPPALRGEKGEILRLRRTSWSVPPPRHVIRGLWHGRPVYLVPRRDGLVLGATQYEAVDGADLAPQAGGVADLLADAAEVFPGLRTYELTEVAAGIRPSAPGGMPIVERVDERVLVATGHGRNGIVLAPWTARRVAGLLGHGAADGSAEDVGAAELGTAERGAGEVGAGEVGAAGLGTAGLGTEDVLNTR